MSMTREQLISVIQRGMSEKGYNKLSLARAAKVPDDTVRDFLSGRSKMLKADKAASILAALNVNLEQPSYDEEAMQCAMQAMEETIARTKAHLNVKERVSFLSRLYKLALRETELSGTPTIGAASAEELLQRMKN